MEDQKIEIKNKMNNKMNVKPKNLNVMKRNLFKLMMLVGLVVIANTNFAAGTKYNPSPNETYTYMISGLATGDSVTFKVNQDSTAAGFSTAHMASFASIDSIGSKIVGDSIGGSGTLTNVFAKLTWTCDTGHVNLWIEVITPGASGCSNYRWIDVYIESTFDISVIALGIDDILDNNTDYYGSTTAATGPVCPVFGDGLTTDTVNFDNTADNEGYSYFYFTVKRADLTPVGTWDFTFSTTNSTSLPTSSIRYYDGSSWSGSVPTGIAAGSSVLVAVKVDNVGGTSYTIDGEAEGNQASCTEPKATDNASLVVSEMPDLSGVGFN